MTKQKARIIGLVYLLFFLTSVLSDACLKGLVVKNDGAATANAIIAHEQLFHLGVATGLIETGLYLALSALFYVLFKPVSRSVSLVAAFFGLVGCAIQASGSVFQFFTLANLGNGGAVSIFSSDELSGRAVGMLFLKLNDQAGMRRPGIFRSVLPGDRLSYSAIDLPTTLSWSVDDTRRFRLATIFVPAISRATFRLYRNCWHYCGSAVDALAAGHWRKHRPMAGTSSGFKNFEQLNSYIISRL